MSRMYSYAVLQIEYVRRIKPLIEVMRRQVERLRRVSGRGGDESSCRRCLKSQVIASRKFAIITIEQLELARGELNRLRRMRSKGKSDGVVIMPLETRYKKQQRLVSELWGQLGDCGSIMADVLDTWQLKGGTVEELLELCPVKKRRDLYGDESFSRLIWKQRLDYDGGVLDISCFGPMTHALNALFSQRLDKALIQDKLAQMKSAIASSTRGLPLSDKAKRQLAQMVRLVYYDKDIDDARYGRCFRVCSEIMDLLSRKGYGSTQNAENYLAECSMEDVEEWLDMICPKIITKPELLEILKKP